MATDDVPWDPNVERPLAIAVAVTSSGTSYVMTTNLGRVLTYPGSLVRGTQRIWHEITPDFVRSKNK